MIEAGYSGAQPQPESACLYPGSWFISYAIVFEYGSQTIEFAFARWMRFAFVPCLALRL